MMIHKKLLRIFIPKINLNLVFSNEEQLKKLAKN